jgi:hypothetical protein
MGETTLGSEAIRGLLICLGVLGLAAIGGVLRIRDDWKALRHKLFRPNEGVEKSSRPGRVVERLDSDRWDTAFGESLARACRDFEGEGTSARSAFEGVAAAREELWPLVDTVARRAMTSGDLESALVRIDRAIVYLLVFPGRHDDRRRFRGYQAFARGWPAHASAVRRAASGEGSNLPVVGLLYFLGLDAREGTLLVSYEGDDGPRFSPDLAEPPGGPTGAPALTYEFSMA